MKWTLSWGSYVVTKKVSLEFLFVFLVIGCGYAVAPFEHIYLAYFARLIASFFFKDNSGWSEKLSCKGQTLYILRPTHVAFAFHLLATLSILVFYALFEKIGGLYLELYYECADLMHQIITSVAIAALDAVMLVTLARYLVKGALNFKR
jgi:hypothetical protein